MTEDSVSSFIFIADYSGVKFFLTLWILLVFHPHNLELLHVFHYF